MATLQNEDKQAKMKSQIQPKANFTPSQSGWKGTEETCTIIANTSMFAAPASNVSETDITSKVACPPANNQTRPHTQTNPHLPPVQSHTYDHAEREKDGIHNHASGGGW